MSKQILTNFALFIDGKAYIGEAKEIEMPNITPKTIDYLAGGMTSPIKVRTGILELLDASITMASYNTEILTHFNFVCGAEAVPVVARGAVCVENVGTQAMTVTMRASITSAELGTWKPGEENTMKYGLNLNYLKIEQNGAIVTEIDVANMVLNINGTDQLADVRAALGI